MTWYLPLTTTPNAEWYMALGQIMDLLLFVCLIAALASFVLSPTKVYGRLTGRAFAAIIGLIGGLILSSVALLTDWSVAELNPSAVTLVAGTIIAYFLVYKTIRDVAKAPEELAFSVAFVLAYL